MSYPNGVYMAVHLSRDTEEKIKEYCSHHIPGMDMNEDLHSTVIFSKKPVDKKIERKPMRMKGGFKGFSKFGDEGESLVIELDSQDLVNLNKEMTSEHSFISDFDEYKPHITISYNGKDIDVENLPPMDFDFDMEHPIIENIEEGCGCDSMDKEKHSEESEDDNDDEEFESNGFVM